MANSPSSRLFEEFRRTTEECGWQASMTNPTMNFQAEARDNETCVLHGVRLQRVLLMSAFGGANFGDRGRLRLISGWAVERDSDKPGASRALNRSRVKPGGILVFEKCQQKQPPKTPHEAAAQWAGAAAADLITGSREWDKSLVLMKRWAEEIWPTHWTNHAIMEMLRMQLVPARLTPHLHRLNEIPSGPWRVLLVVASPIIHHQSLQTGFRITQTVSNLCRNYKNRNFT